jgi:phosphoribosylaminoimidazolecarboxamide formyltransferase/IMP cyclohydrolase
MHEHGIRPIDIVCVNLYPFAQTIARIDASFDDAVENIDIGGPAMIRAAGKNHDHVAVVTEPSQYASLLADLRAHHGKTSAPLRRRLAQSAFAHVSRYDAMIADYLLNHVESPSDANSTSSTGSPATDVAPSDALPERLSIRLDRAEILRYGENPHQSAALYRIQAEASTGVANATQLHGKQLSYINLLDADAALACVNEFESPAACIVKHATPCGVAIGIDLADAFAKAYDADALAAFGGIVALNRAVDRATAEVITAGQKFLEVIVAPGYSDEARDLLAARWKNVRLLQLPSARSSQPSVISALSMHRIGGGMLVQRRDDISVVSSEWKVVSKRTPSETEMRDLAFAWVACKHIKSNAIVIAQSGRTVGIGGGQVDRVGAAKIAIEKAGERTHGASAASDAFFPFPDGPEALIRAGVTAIVQPGGSQRDALSIEAVDHADVAMVFTGRRHFRH